MDSGEPIPKQCLIKTDYTLIKWTNPCVIQRKEESESQLSCEEFILDKPKPGTLTDLLNTIHPPREWEEDGILRIQFLSPEPATRPDVIKLAEKLDYSLIELGARETGICDVRRSIYTELFDELIRQETINCSERGLMLMRVRDETMMTLHTYRKLYESSIAYGIRKAIEAEEGKKELEDQIEKLKSAVQIVEEQLDDITRKYNENERRFGERRNLEEAKHRAQMDFMQKTNKTLRMQLESIIGPKK